MLLHLVVDRIYHDRTYRDPTVFYGIPVRYRIEIHLLRFTVDKVVRSSPGRLKGQKAILVSSHGRDGDIHTFVAGDIGSVDVDEVIVVPERDQFIQILHDELRHAVKVERRVKRVERYRDARYLFVRRLPRRGAGAGVYDVRPEVGADVDTGDDDLRHHRNRPEGSENDTIRGRPAGGVGLLLDQGTADRLRKGDHIGNTASLAVGSDDPHLMIARERRCEALETWTEHTVVVGKQDRHERTVAPQVTSVKAEVHNFGDTRYSQLVTYLLTLFSALLLPLSLPNELFTGGVPVFGLFALVPLFLAIHRTTSVRHAVGLGAIFGAVSTALANYWLAFFGEFSVWTIGGTVLGYTGYNAMLFAFLYHGIHHFRADPFRSGTIHPTAIAVIWTGYEYLKSVGFLAYPWGLIAYPIAGWNTVAQIAELTGVWGLSFIAAFANAAIAEAILRGFQRSGVSENTPGSRVTEAFRASLLAVYHAPLAAALVLLLAAGWGSIALRRVQPDRALTITLVQQNVDSWHPGRFADALMTAQNLTLDALENARREGREVDFVVWSETALRRPYSPEDPFFNAEPAPLPFNRFLRQIRVPLVTGAPMRAANGSDAHNSALVILPDGSVPGSYGKQQLVPFAESIPFWENPAVQRFFKEVIGLYGTWVPGAGSTVIELPLERGTIAIGTPICFEDAFGWVLREMQLNGAELYVNLTNNSWSRQRSAQTQHLVAARLRTIELRQTLVRGTNSGVSAVVDARGVLRESVPMFESRADTVEVPVYPRTRTLYTLIGDLFGRLAVLASLLGPVLVLIRHKKNRRA